MRPNPSTPDTLLLWDIDGTLLSTARAGIRAWEDAVKAVLGRTVDLSDSFTAGLTDWMIARGLVAQFGTPAGSELEWQLIDEYTASLPRRLEERRGGVLPNVVAALEALTATGRVRNVLLTGNARAGARAKLASYDLDHWFDDGGFCDDGFERVTIGRCILGRVAEGPEAIGRQRTFVIGDTPLDIACGHELGVRVIAVATGGHSLGELSQHDPWWAVDELPPPPELLSRLDLL